MEKSVLKPSRKNNCRCIKIAALAKINLYLHITGKKDNGYHLLDSLFAFANYGDTIILKPSEHFSFKIRGRFAKQLLDAEDTNIVLKTVEQMQKYTDQRNVDITLFKNLPVASGIGGGSSDAAATIKGLCSLWNLKLDKDILEEIAVNLGADVLACLQEESIQVSGIGEIVNEYKMVPKIYGILVNPMIAVSTKAVFKNYLPVFSKPMPLSNKPLNKIDFLEEIKKRKNDLEETAIKICPEIKTVLDSILDTKGCMLSRMSGSGGSCFGLYLSRKDAVEAKKRISNMFKEWWVKEIVIKK